MWSIKKKSKQWFLDCGNWRMGRRMCRASAGEGEGGQTHWLAAEGKKWKKRRRREYKEIWFLAVSHLTLVYEERGSNLSLHSDFQFPAMSWYLDHIYDCIYLNFLCTKNIFSIFFLIRLFWTQIKWVIDLTMKYEAKGEFIEIEDTSSLYIINRAIKLYWNIQWSSVWAKDCVTKWFNRVNRLVRTERLIGIIYEIFLNIPTMNSLPIYLSVHLSIHP